MSLRVSGGSLKNRFSMMSASRLLRMGFAAEQATQITTPLFLGVKVVLVRAIVQEVVEQAVFPARLSGMAQSRETRAFACDSLPVCTW
jgi:hypothetical protein